MTGAGLLVPAAVAFLAAAALAFVLTPAVRRLAQRVDAVDHPHERRVNTTPVPRGGGVAVAVAFLVVVAALFVGRRDRGPVGPARRAGPAGDRGPPAGRRRGGRWSACSTIASTCARGGSSAASSSSP